MAKISLKQKAKEEKGTHTFASSKPSISVSRVDKSLSPTVALLLELSPLQSRKNSI